ncbi:putative ATPase [Shewanella psychrophila]|uniref:Putative ATPase n=1 Tax=Shewanella psychrophila TaxID=225848 RepID=A0A1S6HT46_9GAMM|nr:AAA family ATPase [Shewanella psychrophila]AQS38638.1 putative ATPase [Shewanella psychrophila]
MNNFIVFTGGPGSGKTSVINALMDSGFLCTNEVGRQVILSQVAQKGAALPWNNKLAFRDEMVRQEMLAHHHYQNSTHRVFFDRGIVDSYGYSTLEKLTVSEKLINGCQTLRYNPNVFIFPPWEAIYSNDTERKQEFEEAMTTYEHMVSAYQEFGYSLIEVPKTSVVERLTFILKLTNHD